MQREGRTISGSEVIHAFTEEQVSRLTGTTVGQLRYWDRTGFFRPEFGYEERRDAYSRIYSYLDLVSLKVIARLRQRVPLQRLRAVKEKLAKISPDLWRGVSLWVHGDREVAVVHPETGEPEEVISGQRPMELPLSEITDDLEEAVRALTRRDGATVGTIVQSRRVMRNKPVIGGTRIPVSAVLAFHDAGYSVGADHRGVSLAYTARCQSCHRGLRSRRLTPRKLILRLFLDEGAPRSVGLFFKENGHDVTYMQDEMARGSPDLLVSEVALRNNAILVAVDRDMKRIASRHGIWSSRFRRLHLLQFLCLEPQAVHRLREALSLVEHEWEIAQRKVARRFWVEIGDSFIRTRR